MYLFKFSLISFFIFNSFVSSAFDDMFCLDASFDINVSHKSAPFGLLEKKIQIKKEACEIEVHLNSYMFVKDSWLVDVCREPVHVKYNNQLSSYKVLRKNGVCPRKNDPYCESILELQKEIQDNGLVYAKGEKEQLTTDHGKTYCAYLLIKKYTNEGFVFSRQHDYQKQILNKKPSAMGDAMGGVEEEPAAQLGSGKF